jgi:hypothetical protein
VRLDSAVIVEGQLCTYESVIELSRFNLEGLHIASELFFSSFVNNLEDTAVSGSRGAVDDHTKVWLNGHRDRT